MLLLVVPLLTLEADARGGHRRSLPKPYSPIVFDDSRALAQGDWCPGPAVTGCQVGCLRELKVFDTSQVLYDVLAIGIPQVDAVSEMRAVVYRHFSLPQSSSASRHQSKELELLARTVGPAMISANCVAGRDRGKGLLSARQLIGAATTALSLITGAFLLALAAGNARAQGSAAACDAAGEIALLPSPWAPWKGAPLRVMLVTEKPLQGELSLTGSPMDFSAWFEAFVGGRWHTFDARHNIPRIGRILIARGRDAADVAISTTFGQTSLKSFVVTTREVEQAALSSGEALMMASHR
jgi:hypothetical protein